MGLVVVHTQGDATEQYFYGKISVDDPRSPDGSSQFEIGSISKVFTHLLLAEMVAKGRLSYDTSLSSLLPELDFENPEVGRITLLELGTHTSGLPRLPNNLMMTDPADPYVDYAGQDLLEAIRTTRPDQQLNKEFSYSNFGVGLLGYLLGMVDNTDYAQALDRHMLQALGMTAMTLGDSETLLPGHHAGKVVSNWQ